jgi:hypothetical protein
MSKMAPQQENAPPLLEPVASEVQIRNVPAGLSRIELAGITQYHSGEFSASALADAAASNDHRIRTTNDVMSDLNQFLVPYEAPPVAPAPGPGTVFAAAGTVAEVMVANAALQRLISRPELLGKLWPRVKTVLRPWAKTFGESPANAEKVAKRHASAVTNASKSFEIEVAGQENAGEILKAFSALKEAVARAMTSPKP